MRIGIDARFLTHPQPGGFKTYTENLVKALAGLDKENEYILYLDRQPGPSDIIPAQSNFQIRVVPVNFPLLGFPWREQIQLPRQAANDRIDLFHFPCLTAPVKLACPMVITVHDMIWAFPDKISHGGSRSVKRILMGLYNYFVPKHAIRSASAIITVSNAARETIVEHLDSPPERIYVTWEAAQSCFFQVRDEQCLDAVRNKYELPSKFILAIGSSDPRKNIANLVQAYSRLPVELQDEYILAIVWSHSLLADAISRQVAELGLEKCVRFLRQVTNEDLALLYNAASLFVFPSRYEGFGLPLLEAMACGTPVIAANNSSIPEIAGDAALFFEAQDADEISSVIQQVLSDDQLRLALSKRGIEHAASFSWEKCARETLNVYKIVLETPSPGK